MKLFVFGASGLIGRALTRAAVDGGHQVRALARSAGSADIVRGLGAQPIRGDMTDPASWRDAAGACDAIVQVAAAFGGDLAAADAIWTDAIIDLSRDRATPLRVVYTGGCWLFPAQTDPPLNEFSAFDPLPPFRYMVENRARLLAAGVALTTIHPGMVWSETEGCTAGITAALSRGNPVEVVGSTTVRWPLVHAEDLASLYLLACSPEASGRDFFGVTDAGVSIAEIVAEAELATGAVGVMDIMTVDDAIRENGDVAAGQARSQRIETDLAQRLLGWRPARPFRLASRVPD